MAFAQAALGAKVRIPGIVGGADGEHELEIPAGSQHGDVVVIERAGMTQLQSRERGDLHVVLQLVVPKKLTDDQRRLLAEYAQTEKVDVRGGDSSFWKKINPFGG
jgi:molecular chaperone DnaJ